MPSKPRHFLDFSSISADDLRLMITEAARRKQARAGRPKGALDDDAPLAGHTLAMIFEKSSTRTRISFDMAIRQLGGSSIVMSAGDMQLGRGESVEDTARVLSRYVDMVMIRANSHAAVQQLASSASVPVVNGLTDFNHPCQLMADILTFEELRGPIAGKHIAWVGDGNNVATSWIEAAIRFGFKLTLACPPAYSPDDKIMGQARAAGADVSLTHDPAAAVRGADAVNADTWVSMGDEDYDERMQLLAPYRVDEQLMQQASDGALFMHCLPAHRGEEVTASVIDGPASAVFDQAENRLHAQKAVLVWCAGLI